MNLQTLTSGSIVSIDGKLFSFKDWIKPDKSKCSLIGHNKWGVPHIYEVHTENLQPVPITPELLECFKDEFKMEKSNSKKGDFETINYELVTDPASNRLAFSYDINHNNIHFELQWVDLIWFIYVNPPIHLVQHFLRGIDGLDFEITLDKLKDLKHGKS